MNRPSVSESIQAALKNICPRCKAGEIFYAGVRMRPRCPNCGYVFEREPGYFIGAMIFSYFLGAFSSIPTLVIGIMVLRHNITSVAVAACLQVTLLAPLLFRFSRLLWIHLDYRTDPEKS